MIDGVVHSGEFGPIAPIGAFGNWIHKLTNLQYGTIYQGTYHQGIHHDSSWHYKDGEESIANLIYLAGGNHRINHYTTSAPLVQGDKASSYLYIMR